MNSIYLAHTPYHILLAYAIAYDLDNSTTKNLVVTADFDNSSLFCDLLNRYEYNPFSSINLVCGNYGLKSNASKFVMSKKIIHNLNNFFLENAANKIYIFNDRRLESQFLINKNRINNLTFYIEDGANAYSSEVLPKWNFFTKYFLKFSFGSWVNDINVLGTSKDISCCFALQPQYLRAELSNKKSFQIPIESFSLLSGSFFPSILKAYNVDIHKDYKVIVVLSHSEFFKSSYSQSFINYCNIIKTLKRLCSNIYLKFHPRENDTDYIDTFCTMFDNCNILPKGLPLEILWLSLLSKPPAIIIGDKSTAIITAAVIFRDMSKIISVSNLFNKLEVQDYFTNNLENMGIVSPSTLSEFELEISKSFNVD